MKNNKKEKLVPELRFPEFEGEWENNKLGNIAEFDKGKNISKADISEDGEIECIRYGELYTRYKEIIEEVYSRTNLDKEELVFSEKGDVLTPSSGETAIDIATASCINKDDVALGGDINIIRSDINGNFLAYYLSNKKRTDVARLAQGISVIHLYKSHLKSLSVNLPSKQEQQKISSFLSLIDKKIELLKKKKELLELYKKGVMQKIFNQEIRFKDKDGNDYSEWEEKKLGEVCSNKKSGLLAREIKEEHDKYPVYGADGITGYSDKYQERQDFVSIVKDGAGVGRVKFCRGKASVVGTLDIIMPKGDNDIFFLYLLLSMLRLRRYVVGSTIPHLYFKDYRNIKVEVPSFSIQVEISQTISLLEKKNSNIDRIISSTQVFKSGLLQKLFI
ncbi:MAG: Type I restriction-modification system, specificity subunit S [candidate division WS6 bacterium 34_10]|uniref:Type I restriction-modification system, specificity subunit S n=1 Tax=candidate division WS6 bacterium 34_10 TaxID=1641389 RepID=A0A101HJ16_9BACT|nr:MAG: Type I restriction-modification system, specificity subunit S [candidate division WS6 bacterium 34_10]